jgi:SAM-dependent methyltransferase
LDTTELGRSVIVVTDPTSTPAAETMAGAGSWYYDAFPDLFDRFTDIWDRINDSFGRWVTAHLATGARALDLGCGAGRHTVLLADRYADVLAVDISAGMLDLARKSRHRSNIVYQHRDIRAVTPDGDGLFDAVLSMHTLHHLGWPDEVLPHVRSLVAPGGVAILADIVDPGGWSTYQFHLDRAFSDARAVYDHTGDPEAAADILRLLLHPRWLDMEVAEPLLSREEFHDHYSRAFPGAVVNDDLHPLICGVVWRAPQAGQ